MKHFSAIRILILLVCIPLFTQSILYDEEVVINNLLVFKTELHALLTARELPPGTRIIVTDLSSQQAKSDAWTVNKENELVHPSTAYAWVDEESFSIWQSDEKVNLIPIYYHSQFLPDTNYVGTDGKTTTIRHIKTTNQYIYTKTRYSNGRLTDSVYYHQFGDTAFRYVSYFSFDEPLSLYVNQYIHLPDPGYLKTTSSFTDTSFEKYRNDTERKVHLLTKDKKGRIVEVRVTNYEQSTDEITAIHKMKIIYPASPK
ncbi:MAG: hypothetical protein IM638_09625 [Bacteroidetes bacterium]|nr:hypothetical protein [Bacteroidota bacterium]